MSTSHHDNPAFHCPSLIAFKQIIQKNHIMSSELSRNESSSQTPQPPVLQNRSLPMSEQQRWNLAARMTNMEEQNYYLQLYQEWVVRIYGVQAVSLPP